jgi:hypothetical protein
MHELTDAVDDLRLVRLQMPDEVPPKGIAVLGVFALEVLCPVLPDDLDTGFGEHGHVRHRDVFGGRDDGHSLTGLVPNARVIRAHGVRRQGR